MTTQHRPPKKILKPMPMPEPTTPATFTDVEAHAIQAIIRGEATAHQQKMAMQWIITQCAGTSAFHSDHRLEAFGLGRAFVRDQLIGIARIDLVKLDQPTTKEN